MKETDFGYTSEPYFLQDVKFTFFLSQSVGS